MALEKADSVESIELEASDHRLTLDNFETILKYVVSDHSIAQWPDAMTQIVQSYIKGIIDFTRLNFIDCDANSGDPLPDTLTTRYFERTLKMPDVVRQIAAEYFPDLRHQFTYESSDGLDARDYIRVWASLQFFVDTHLFTVRNRRVNISIDDISDVISATNDRLDRWIEIADDYMTRLEICEFTDNVTFMIERRNICDDIDSKDDATVKPVSLSEECWPRHRLNPNGPPFHCRIGDMIDAMDEMEKWYQCFVRCIEQRCVNEDSNEMKPHICVHFMGWNAKWDDWIAIDNDKKLSKRGTFCARIHRHKRRRPSLHSYEPPMQTQPNVNANGNDHEQYWEGLVSLHGMGFTNSEANLVALQHSNGDVQTAANHLMGD